MLVSGYTTHDLSVGRKVGYVFFIIREKMLRQDCTIFWCVSVWGGGRIEPLLVISFGHYCDRTMHVVERKLTFILTVHCRVQKQTNKKTQEQYFWWETGITASKKKNFLKIKDGIILLDQKNEVRHGSLSFRDVSSMLSEWGCVFIN